MIFFLIDLCATVPSLLLLPAVSICMSDKLKALAIDLDGILLVGESLSERNRHAGCNRVLLKSYSVSAMRTAALPASTELSRIATV